MTLFIVPFCSEAARLRLRASWAGTLLDVFGLELETDLKHAPPGALLVANHVSWIDIYVINSVFPAAFVAKAEVRDWPLIGWLAARHDTIFLRRGSRGHARLINEEIGQILARGRHVAVFPEGTTTDGTRLLHFHAALIEPALAGKYPVMPVAISYWEPDGSRSLAPRYDGDISLGQCARAILGRRRLIARLVTTAPLGINGENRKQVAVQAHAAISRAASIVAPPSPESPATELATPDSATRLAA